MGLFDLLTNTVEGVAQAAISPVKVAVGVVVAPLDRGETLARGIEDTVKGVRKIGSSDPQSKEPKA